MLPPEIELRHDREYSLTDAGPRVSCTNFAAAGELADIESAELEMLRHFEKATSRVPSHSAAPLARRRSRRRKAHPPRLSHRARSAAPSQNAHAENRRLESRADAGNGSAARSTRHAEEQNPRSAHRHARPAAARIAPRKSRRLPRRRSSASKKTAACSRWEEPLTPDEDPWDTDFTPPTNVLNAEQKEALDEIWRWLVAGKFAAGLLHGVTGSGKTEVYLGAIEAALSRGKIGHRAGSGNRAHALGRPAGARAFRRNAWPCCTAACRISSAPANGGACATEKRASWSARARRFSRRSKISA